MLPGRTASALAVLLTIGIPGTAAAGLAGQSLELVSRVHPGQSSDTAQPSEARALSADGRWVAFESRSLRILPLQEDTNGGTDVFLYDRTARTTLLVSRSGGSANRTANGPSSQPAISADGRYVVFGSTATDVVAGATDQGHRFFLFDRLTGVTRLIGRTGPFEGQAQPNIARISPDGRWVVFTSSAPDLVPGQQEPAGLDTPDVFLWDRETGSTSLVSRSTAGATVAGNRGSENPLLSDDGRYIAFYSYATDLAPGQGPGGDSDPDLLLQDRTTGETILVGRIADPLVVSGRAEAFSMSADGRFLVFNMWGEEDLESWLFDRSSRASEKIHPASVTPRISADGRYVVYSDLLDEQIYLWDRAARTATLVTRSSPAGGNSDGFPGSYAISATGRYVAFLSDGTDLVPGQVSAPGRANEDLFLFDRTTNKILLVSRSETSPVSAVGGAGTPLLSASGEQVAFTSRVDAAPGDSNALSDAYLFSLTGTTGGGGPVPLPTCKLLDTRRRADRPALRSNTHRTVRAAGVCGVPATAKSVAVTVTALQATGKGNLRLYAGNNTVTSSGILRFEKTATRSATFTVPLATNGAGTLSILPFVAGKGTVQVIVEVRGYSE